MLLFWNRPVANGQDAAAERTKRRLGRNFVTRLDALHENALRTGVVSKNDLQEANGTYGTLENPNRVNVCYALGIMAFIMIATPIFHEIITFLLGIRCFLPNNHLVWEATRPISDCGFCSDVKGPLILDNATQRELAPFAYSSHPILIKGAVLHWEARSVLRYSFLKELYKRTPGALDEDCHFLHFRSDLKTLREVFEMPLERVNMTGDFQAWYVGWSVCNSEVLTEIRRLYPKPHFLPVDAEMPGNDYIFLGYEQGAIMHLSNLPRLMWQAQLQGQKNWILAPTPECDHICQSFSFEVEAGDAVLIDTRIWYHGTTSIPKGQFALTIQSEYS